MDNFPGSRIKASSSGQPVPPAVGSTEERQMNGYVTALSFIAGLSHAELANALGFAVGTLSNGYRVYQLAAPVGPDDFEWKDRTRYSAGWRGDRSLGYKVRRVDELRAEFGKQHSYDEAAVDRSLAAFHAAQLEKLQVRSGPDRIVRIVPNLRPSSYPDSDWRDVPQWELKNEKRFIFVGTSI
jgi:hypothetical protein